MRKKELIEFIEGKVKAEKQKFIDDIREEITARVEPLIATIFDRMEYIERTANALMDNYQKELASFGLEKNWNDLEVVREVNNHLLGWSKYRRNDIRNTMINVTLNPYSDNYNRMRALAKYNDRLPSLGEALIEEYEGKREQIKHFGILQGELFTVIDNAISAKKAYQALLDLGVDMKGFGDDQLPAVTKLSVDACLINGGCQ